MMAGGGIYDQLGGGFHRYAVDARWLIPHFEKMLTDNAMLSRIYLDVFLLIGDAEDRLTRDMLRVIRAAYLPNRVIACGMSGEPALLSDRTQIDGKTTAYVCENQACLPPTTSPAALAELLA